MSFSFSRSFSLGLTISVSFLAATRRNLFYFISYSFIFYSQFYLLRLPFKHFDASLVANEGGKLNEYLDTTWKGRKCASFRGKVNVDDLKRWRNDLIYLNFV